MTDLIELSSRIIDSGDLETTTNRVTLELSEVGENLAIVEAFSHIWAVDSGDGLVLFDTSHARAGRGAVRSIRGWRDDRVHTVVYTHGHVDHVGGSGWFVAEARDRGRAVPEVVAHEAVLPRFARYRETAGWNLVINARQFGGSEKSTRGIGVGPDDFLPTDVAPPTVTHEAGMTLRVGDDVFELHHATGETDDHTWIWDERRRAVFSGDLFIWNFPNAGNPQKVQRFAGDWATALRAIAAKEPELLLPAHGLPVGGRERVATVLDQAASALEYLVRETVALMNQGASLDTILHTVQLPDHYLRLPYLVPNYDEPEFVIRNIYRLYGGWWDGDPSSLHPAPKSALGAAVAELAGGPAALANRALEVLDRGDLAVAGHLVQMAADAAPDDPEVHEARARVFAARREEATSLMAKGIYSSAVATSREVVDGPADDGGDGASAS